jgi:hypothetical protein
LAVISASRKRAREEGQKNKCISEYNCKYINIESNNNLSTPLTHLSQCQSFCSPVLLRNSSPTLQKPQGGDVQDVL